MTAATVILVLTEGFEEIEAVSTIDVLRRGGIKVDTASLTGHTVVHGKHAIPITADTVFEDAPLHSADALIIPGGTVAFNEHDGLKAAVQQFAREGKLLAAICAAPIVLGGLGLLEGRKATCYPGFESYLSGADIESQAAVIVDGNIITGRGPAFVLDFALQIVAALAGPARADEVASGLLLPV